MRRKQTAVLVLATLSADAIAQSWIEQFPLISPPARDTHGMAFEPVSGRVVLCGGFNIVSGHSADTWEWDGLSWSATQPSTAPMGRETFGFCADGTGGVLLFGGYTAIPGGPPNRVFNDTWRYFQGSWTRLSPAQSPSPRRWPGMTNTANGVILFGGSSSGRTTTYGDTWRWDGANWTQLSPSSSPSGRWGHWMTFDSWRNVAVMFGGMPVDPAPRLSDTWEFDGVNWQQRQPAQHPSPRTEHALAFDELRGRTVLFGGQDGVTSRYQDTWEWDGVNWSMLTTAVAPSPRDSVGMAFDGNTQQMLLFGGYGSRGTYTGSLGDTFLLAANAPPASYTPFGTPCSSTLATPLLQPWLGETPRIGSTSRLRLSGLPQLAITVFVLGFSDSQNSGPLGAYVLPFELSPLGFPGCWQHVSDDSTHFALALNGQVDWQIALPSYAALVGFPFFVQAAVPDAVTSGLSLSNAVAAVIGY